MSISLEFSSLSRKQKEYIAKRCTVLPKFDPFNKKKRKEIYLFETNIASDEVNIPSGIWRDFFDEYPYSVSDFDTIDCPVNFCLYTSETDPENRKRDQNVVAEEALTQLQAKFTTFIACFTGFGKTRLTIYLWSKLGLKGCIVCHLDVVRKQWYDTIRKVCPNTKVQIVKSAKLDPNADVYIMGVKKACNLQRKEFERIGTVIFDETHLCTYATFVYCIFQFRPRYVIGLSATPDRLDQYEILMEPVFGKLSDFIFRKEKKEFIVYKIQTEFEPIIENIIFEGRSRPNWNLFRKSLSMNPDRQQYIVNVLSAERFQNRKQFVVTFLKEHTICLGELFEAKNISVDTFYGNKKGYNPEAKIIVLGSKKGGTGLDDSSRDMLSVVYSTRDIRQIEGRIRQSNNIIVDFVDNHYLCEKHWNERQKHYTAKGAEIIIEGVSHSHLSTKMSTKVQKLI